MMKSLSKFLNEALVNKKVNIGELSKLDNGTYLLCNKYDIKYIVLRDEQGTYIIINPKNALKQSEFIAIYIKLFPKEDNANMYDILDIYKQLLDTTYGKHLDKAIEYAESNGQSANSHLSVMQDKLEKLCGEINFSQNDPDLKKLEGVVYQMEENLEPYDSIYRIEGDIIYKH